MLQDLTWLRCVFRCQCIGFCYCSERIEFSYAAIGPPEMSKHICTLIIMSREQAFQDSQDMLTRSTRMSLKKRTEFRLSIQRTFLLGWIKFKRSMEAYRLSKMYRLALNLENALPFLECLAPERQLCSSALPVKCIQQQVNWPSMVLMWPQQWAFIRPGSRSATAHNSTASLRTWPSLSILRFTRLLKALTRESDLSWSCS